MAIANVLVIRPGALGDALLTLPALCALHRAGAARITIMGTPASWAFLRVDETGFLRAVDFASGQWLGLFSDEGLLSLEARSLLQNTRIALVYLTGDTNAIHRRLKAVGVEEVLTIDPPTGSGIDISQTALPHGPLDWRHLAASHAARLLSDPLASIDSKFVANRALDLVLNPALLERLNWLMPTTDEMHAARKYLVEHAGIDEGEVFFALHPGSGGRKKCWPAECFAKLTAQIVEETGMHALVFFGPADDVVQREFSSIMPLKTRCHAVSHSPLRHVLALLHCSRFFVGNDSGMSHLAARVTQTIALFGPTNPRVWAPIGRRVAIMSAQDGLLKSLSVERVMDQVRTSLVNNGSTI